jgi:hypothetical protein
VLVFRLDFSLYLLMAVRPFEGATLVPNGGAIRKLLSQGFRVMSVLNGKERRDGFGLLERHFCSQAIKSSHLVMPCVALNSSIRGQA